MSTAPSTVPTRFFHASAYTLQEMFVCLIEYHLKGYILSNFRWESRVSQTNGDTKKLINKIIQQKYKKLFISNIVFVLIKKANKKQTMYN